jgi:hypothetical protein
MARARVRITKQHNEIARVIIAEWLRILPETNPALPAKPMDANALTAAFNSILEEPCQVVLDEENLVKIAVPRPPLGVRTQAQLQTYLDNNNDFIPGMSAAVLFGCGR